MAGALVIGLALVVAAYALAGRLAGSLGQGSLDVADLGLLSASLVAGAGLLVGSYALAVQPGGRWLAFGMALLLLVSLRVWTIAHIDAVLAHDPLFLNELALDVADGRCCFSDRPMGYPIVLGVAYALFGEARVVAEVLNVMVAVVTGILLHDLVRVTWSDAAAAVALTAYALLPSQVLLVTVPVTEPIYALALLAAIRLTVTARRAGLAAISLAGLTLGLSQYVRPTSIALLPAFWIIPWLIDRASARLLVVRAAVVLAGFLVVLLPVLEYNLRTHDELSVATSEYAGWSLYVGTNQHSNGMWNPEDARRFAAFPGETWWERSEVAGREGIRRITEDPAGFVALAIRKFRVLWGDEDYAPSHVVGNAEVPALSLVVTSAFYVGLLATALGGLWFERRDPTKTAMLILGITVTVAAIHTFVEVSSRYHAYLVPLWCALAGAGIAAVLSSTRRAVASIRS